jgi:hypothetical protein
LLLHRIILQTAHKRLCKIWGDAESYHRRKKTCQRRKRSRRCIRPTYPRKKNSDVSSGSFIKTYKNPEKTKFKSQDRKKKKKKVGKDARKKTLLLLLFSHRILLLLASSGNGYGSDVHYSDSAKNLKKKKRDSKRRSKKKENNLLWAWQWKRARVVAAASVWGRECCLSQAIAMKEEL